MTIKHFQNLVIGTGVAGVARRKRQMVEGLIDLHMSRFKESGAQLVMGEARSQN